MSGGVGLCSDISLPKEEQQPQQDGIINNISKKQHKPKNGRSLFTFQQMNALAVIIVLSTSGMVSIENATFVAFSLIYIYFMSRVAFPPLSSSPASDQHVFDENYKFKSLLTFLGVVIGLFLPIAYIFEGIFEGDKEGIKAATPHVFLLASQIFMEGVACGGGFSLPVQVFVPVFYNSMRIFTLMDWLRSEIYKVEKENSGGGMRLYGGRLLAIVNASFWCFNLFGFLLPIYLPKAIKIHYSACGGGIKTAKQK